MVPEGFQMLRGHEGFPELDDTEIALVTAPGTPSLAANRLAEHIMRSLETTHAVHVPVPLPVAAQ